ncbi:MAG: 3'(2'),5'-bisphosphate nucleotidase [Phycisphaerales bacterium]
MSDHTRRVEAALHAVALACRVCRAVQTRREAIVSASKDDKSPVTVADFASQAVVAHTLQLALGKVTLVGEEDSAMLRERMAAGDRTLIDAVVDAARLAWPEASADAVLSAIDVGNAEPPVRAGHGGHGGHGGHADQLHGFWTLDPIDGTKGFLRGEQYAVSLAWIEGPAPIIGVLGCPNLSRDFSRPFDDPDPSGVIYFAQRGGGVYELPADDPAAHPVHIRRLAPAEGEPVRMCESVEAAHSDHSASERVLEKLGEPDEPARLDSQAKYAVVARGQADIYLRLPSKKGYVERIWDHAAGALVAVEAGCAVTDARGMPLDFSHGRGLEKNSGILVAPPALHGLALRAIGEVLGG